MKIQEAMIEGFEDDAAERKSRMGKMYRKEKKRCIELVNLVRSRSNPIRQSPMVYEEMAFGHRIRLPISFSYL